MRTFLDKLPPRESFGYLIGSAIAKRNASMWAAKSTDNLTLRKMYARHAREWNRNALANMTAVRAIMNFPRGR